MKLQGISVIFALIVLPLILVLSYYIQLQVETINLQNEYDAKLLDSTRDAMAAFEINTANEDLSTVSDSLRTIIEASTNVFTNTLATNLGMSNASKSYLEPYVPALLYTLYDGYYINAPTQVPTVLTDVDGNAVSVGDPGVDVSGTKYTYTITHTSKESQEECDECKIVRDDSGPIVTYSYDGSTSGHITFDKYSEVGNYLKYDEIVDPTDYGQILYVDKTDPTKYTADIEQAQLKTKNVLKSYMPYAARYKRDNAFDISVVYTLDNYVTIDGTVYYTGGDSIYYTKSGYLLPTNFYTNITDAAGADISTQILSRNQNDAQKYIEDGNFISLTLKDGTVLSSGGQIKLDGTNVLKKDDGTDLIRYEDINEKIVRLKTRIDDAHFYKTSIERAQIAADAQEIIDFIAGTGYPSLSGNNDEKLAQIMELANTEASKLQYELDKMSAMTYYIKGIIFSTWVEDTLGDVRENDLIEIAGQSYKSIKGTDQVTYKFDESDAKIFETKGSTIKGIIEISEDSVFYTHKLNVIRNSIQYNLNLAMSTYNNISSGKSDYSMPVMQNEEWQKILTNPSIVSFMQGYSCGLKIYNNYMIVSSTNNEISILPDNIYYVDKDVFSNETAEYHKIDCPKLLKYDEAGGSHDYIAFSSKETKYDKLYDKTNTILPYSYDHKNYACYDCINDGNYEGTDFLNSTDAKYNELKRAYYTGVAKCKNNLYKMNAIENSQGYETIYYNLTNDPEKNITARVSSKISTLPISEVKAIEIVIGTLKTTNPQETVAQYKIGLSGVNDGDLLTDEIHSIATNVTTNYTLNVLVDPLKPASLSTTDFVSFDILRFINQATNSTVGYENGNDAQGNIIYVTQTDAESGSDIFKRSIKYIRVIYK